MSAEMQDNWIASFWRRISALAIDIVIFGFVGFVLGHFFGDIFAQMGSWGRMVGFVIGLIYFGVMNSSLFAGQTIGKRLLNISVVDAENQTISLVRSVLRYTVLAMPFTLNSTYLPDKSTSYLLIYPLSLIVLGGMFAIIYLYLFNRATRQSLHDFVVGTFVVNTYSVKQETSKIWKAHLIIVAIAFIAATIAPAFIVKLLTDEPYKAMFAASSALSNEPRIMSVNVTTTYQTIIGDNIESQQTTYVSAKAWLASNNVVDSEFAQHLANIVVQHYPEAKQTDAIKITLAYGYDIGIWSQWYRYTRTFDPNALGSME
ncbi:MAG: RDD family protein [Gammaproteobacteria bacterium]|jgi:uncharacterized RDD family membrane protein YckC|nr:RDD family protein [Gammaproteobacteria bacterium]